MRQHALSAQFAAFALMAMSLNQAQSAAAGQTPRATAPHPSTGTAKTPAKAAARVELPALLREVEDKYSKAATLTANFEELNESKALQQKKTSSGVIQFKRPGKFRWETQKPDKSLLVSDGKKFWYYTPPFDQGDNGQYMVKESAQVQSQLARSLLSADFTTALTKQKAKITQNSATEFTLIPKKGTAATVQKAQISIDPASKLITRVTLEHEGGNRSEIKLSGIDLGKALDDKTFVFVPPPNTDLIQE